jgi:serine/threonine-protein kinase RsbW
MVTHEQSELKLSLPARSENLARLRRALADFTESLGADDEAVADVRLAVNEACTNVVRHAYHDGGEIEIEARPVGDHLVVVVHDRGRGLDHPTEDPGTGLGLRVASALAEAIEIRNSGVGTEVRLSFALSGRRAA